MGGFVDKELPQGELRLGLLRPFAGLTKEAKPQVLESR